MVQFTDTDAVKYAAEHEQCDQYYNSVVSSDKEKFEKHYEDWKEAVVRFHKLKQEDAIQKFLDEMNSLKFVNPKSRIEIFNEIQEEQRSLFEQRMSIISELDNERPTQLTVAYVNSLEEKMRNFNEESSVVFDRLVDSLAKDMENTNEDIDIAEFDLKDFIIKNDA